MLTSEIIKACIHIINGNNKNINNIEFGLSSFQGLNFIRRDEKIYLMTPDMVSSNS